MKLASSSNARSLRSSLRGALAAALGVGLAAGGTLASAPVAHALEPAALPIDSIYLPARPDSRLPSAGQAVRSASTSMLADSAPAATRRPEALYGSTASRAVLMEVRETEVAPGQFNRPRYALGFRSDSLKNFAQGMGLDADTCLLPLVRGRLALSRDAGPNGRLMVYARCTFH